MKNNNHLDHYIATKTLVESKKLSTLPEKVSLQVKQWFFIFLKLIIEVIFLIWFIFTLFFILIQLSPYFSSSTTNGAEKYFNFLGHLITFNFGSSEQMGQISDFIWSNIAYTFLMMFIVFVFSSATAIFSSYFLSVKKFKRKKTIFNSVAILSYIFPAFILGIFLILIFPNQKFVEGEGNFLSLFLVFLALYISTSLFYTFLITKSLNNEIEKKYFIFLYSKGLKESEIFKSHLIYPMLYYYVYYLPIIFITMLFNLIALEVLFNIPGLSEIMKISIQNGGDEVLLIDGLMIYGISFILIFSFKELFLKIIDPKIRHLK